MEDNKPNYEFSYYIDGDTQFRHVFTYEQIAMLQNYFIRTQFPTNKQIEDLSKKLNIDKKGVIEWFQNERKRYRISNKEITKKNCQGVTLNTSINDKLVSANKPKAELFQLKEDPNRPFPFVVIPNPINLDRDLTYRSSEPSLYKTTSFKK